MYVKMKSYIKPFEKKLALQELENKTHTRNIACIGQDFYCVKTEVTEEKLISDLAYWESVGETVQKNTMQVLMENTSGMGNEYVQMDLFGQTELNLRKARILRYGVHDLHEYRGKFFPQLVRACINIADIKRGAVVFDPFCGSGTTLCEAKISGMRSMGMDLNPLSVLISKVKTSILDYTRSDLEEAYKTLGSLLRSHASDFSNRWTQSDLKYLYGWFSEEALKDIHQILCAAEQFEDTNIQNFFKLNLSNIIRTVSWQKESDLRVRKEVGIYEAGSAKNLFLQEASRQIKKIGPYLHLVHGLCMYPSDISEDNAVTCDANNTDYLKPCDVLITSPPYATSLPYLDTDRLSLIILGLMHRSEFADKNKGMVGNREVTEKRRKELWNMFLEREHELTDSITALIYKIAEENHKPEVGFRRRNLPALLAKYFLDMLDSMKAAQTVLKPGAKAFYVVGSNSTNVAGKRLKIETNRLLWDLGDKAGWKQEQYLNMDMVPSRDIFCKNQGATEAILVFKQKCEVEDGINGR